MPEIIRFEGELPDGYVIAGHTNPWIQEADSDEPLNLYDTAAELGTLRNDGSCYQCYSCMVQGVIDGMDVPEGIQRCDTCGIYEGDLDAAQALADALTEFTVGAVVHHVWVEIERRAS